MGLDVGKLIRVLERRGEAKVRDMTVGDVRFVAPEAIVVHKKNGMENSVYGFSLDTSALASKQEDGGKVRVERVSGAWFGYQMFIGKEVDYGKFTVLDALPEYPHVENLAAIHDVEIPEKTAPTLPTLQRDSTVAEQHVQGRENEKAVGVRIQMGPAKQEALKRVRKLLKKEYTNDPAEVATELNLRVDTVYFCFRALGIYLSEYKEASWQKLRAVVRELSKSEKKDGAEAAKPETSRQKIWGLLADEKERSEADIAESLGMARSTITYHINSIKAELIQKLGAKALEPTEEELAAARQRREERIRSEAEPFGPKMPWGIRQDKQTDKTDYPVRKRRKEENSEAEPRTLSVRDAMPEVSAAPEEPKVYVEKTVPASVISGLSRTIAAKTPVIYDLSLRGYVEKTVPVSVISSLNRVGKELLGAADKEDLRFGLKRLKR